VTAPRVATLGRPGPTWPRAVARWTASALVPAEVTTCLSPEELRSTVAAGGVAAGLVEVGLPGVDRVLADELHRAGVAVVAVTSPTTCAAAEPLEPDATLTADFGPDDLVAVLRAHARTRARARPPSPPAADHELGRLVAVTGPPGSGASTVAQALATIAARSGRAVLADLALDADQHLRHGAPPGSDGLFEVVDALRHRRGQEVEPPVLTQAPGYDLLCGLRRRQEWTVLRTTTAAEVIAVLRCRYPVVVADVTPDTDGHADCGSIDLEERNSLALAALGHAAPVVVVGRWSTTGLHRLARTLLDLRHHGVAAGALVPVVNGAPRSRRGRAAACRATARLLHGADPDVAWPAPHVLPHDRRVEPAIREASPLPRGLVDRLAPVLAP
jgi:energy-coupling factor transporter ATP-binding protein EcfA2